MLFGETLKLLFKPPATNRFPAKYAPESTIEFLDKVGKGEVELIPPIPTPPDFRGRILYDKDACIGCRSCIRVCPSNAIEFIPEEKKVKIYIANCIGCAQCNDICPTKCLSMSSEFMTANYDKFGEDQVVTGNWTKPKEG